MQLPGKPIHPKYSTNKQNLLVIIITIATLRFLEAVGALVSPLALLVNVMMGSGHL